MCKYVAYIRVSTSEKSAKQTYERQKFLIANCGIKFDAVYEEHISGGVKGTQREQFNKMLETLDEKDVVCFTETSRFGRNYIECFEMLDLITQQKGASVKFLSNGIELEGGEKMNPYTWMTISQFFIQDEFLKRQIGYNTKVALQAKKEQGVILGKPKTEIADETVATVLDLHHRGHSINAIVNQTGLGRKIVVRILKENGENI